MTKKFDMLLDKLKNEAIKAYNKIKKHKNYPHPINMPVGLFDYLENGRLETAYTRTLAYLLDAKAPHGYKDKILKKLLAYCNIKCQNLDFSVSPEFYFAEEKGRFDIFIEGKMDNKPFTFAVEAKIDSTERNEQLEIYNKYLADKPKVIKLYLTIDEKKASSKDWKSISWLKIVNILVNTIQHNQKQAGYEFICYFISSIYSQLYGHNVNCLNIYQLLDESLLDKYAEQIQNETFDFDTFIKYPSAFLVLYQCTPKGCNFDKSFKKCENLLKNKISELLRQNYNGKIHNPSTWNKYIELGTKEYLNLGITNRVLVTKNGFKDGLWWFANINFSSLEKKMQNIEKYKQNKITEKYKNSDMGISRYNIIFLVQKYKDGSLPKLNLNKILEAKKKS